jgi:hypothetical protein
MWEQKMLTGKRQPRNDASRSNTRNQRYASGIHEND